MKPARTPRLSPSPGLGTAPFLSMRLPVIEMPSPDRMKMPFNAKVVCPVPLSAMRLLRISQLSTPLASTDA